MRYDVEVSGFPSSHSGHLVLLRLKDQDYPNTKTLEDWPTWDLPILKWAQGAGRGRRLRAFGLGARGEDARRFRPLEVPRFDGIGANEYIVDVTHDAVDFISTVDTPPAWELNIWYHTLNVGFRTRISGETDFPCIYGDRVGLGRSYVQLPRLDYDAWAQGIRDGRAYVTDGRSHLIDFRVDDRAMGADGSELRLASPRSVRVTAQVAARLDAGPEPRDAGPAPGREAVLGSRARAPRLHARRAGRSHRQRRGRVAPTARHRRRQAARGLRSTCRSSAAAGSRCASCLRRTPTRSSSLVGDRPIRASRASAEWCLKAVDQCWLQKSPKIAAAERDAAAQAYEHARQVYRQRLKRRSRSPQPTPARRRG